METKFKIVETEDYFLAISDEDASNSYIYFTGDPTGIFRTGIKYKNEAGDYFYQDAITGMSDTYLAEISKKIIAYKPKGNAPELDLPLLPDVEDDVENLAEISSELQEGTYTPQHKVTYKHGFIDGYKSATKVHSEEDLIGFAEWIANSKVHGFSKQLYEAIIRHKVKTTKELLGVYLSLKQSKTTPKWFVAEVEKKMVLNLGIDVRNPNTHVYVNELKTTTINNKIYLEGTYLN
jgi:hypothetical protein